jgi:predicted phage terminase large subunit-like protein
MSQKKSKRSSSTVSNDTPLLKAVREVRISLVENKKITGDFIKFRLKYRNRQTPPHQKEMIEHIEGHKFSLILEPRTHGKSETATIDYPMWRVAANRNIRILIVSQSDSLAKDFLRPIKFEMLNNPDMAQDFGLGPFEKESEHEIIVKRTLNLKDSTITSVGWGGGVTGRKVDLIVADDLFDSEDAMSEVFRESMRRWFLKELVNCLDEHGEKKLVVIGTTKHYDDLYATLSKSGDFAVLKRQAILDEEKKITLWPEKFPFEAVDRLRRMLGPIYFSAEYMNDPTPLEGELLKGEWLHYWDADDPTLPHPPEGSGMEVMMGVDPAISKSATADNSSICVVGRDRERGLMFVLKSWAGKVDFPELLNLVGQEVNVWKPTKVFIEENAYQASLIQIAKRISSMPVVGIRNSKDKVSRMITLSPHFQNGRILIHKSMRQLIQEYLQFPKGAHDDSLDALDLAVREWLERGGLSYGVTSFDFGSLMR